ncbi:MAG: Rv1355c family protein [Flavobacteriales bacterium]
MIKTLNALKSASLLAADRWQPDFIRLSDEAARSRMASLVVQPGLSVHDTIGSQLKELVRALNPSVKFTPEALEAAALGHIGTIPLDEYGVWVHYTWSNRLVHLLDEVEFVLVRTDRNRNKITREEQAVLATKRIGVIGLSVGQSIALTMAMERSFGELRLADHDTLDLSNLNRIRSGVHHLGLKKVVNVAREIMEIDPFLKVTLFPEGINRGNIEQFCTDGGKLDVLVDECDSVDVKIFSRQTAKGLGIPVVMDTSDRGMIDVERFDLEPERPILHGLIEHLDVTLAAQAKTNEEKLPFLAPMAALDDLSPRMKASMLDLGTSIVTWPQLGSAVALGGAVVAELVRWILLGHDLPSQRRYVDIESAFRPRSAANRADSIASEARPAAPGLHEMISALSLVTGVKGGLDEKTAVEIVKAGALAPSAGNSQPWKFVFHDGSIALFHDTSRSYSALDSRGLTGLLSLGACIENMQVKSSALGVGIALRTLPLGEEHRLVALIEGAPSLAGSCDDELAGEIGKRHTTRRYSENERLSVLERSALLSMIGGEGGVSLTLVEDRRELEAIGDLCGRAERLRVINEHGHTEFFEHEVRWSPEEVDRTRDGLDIRTLELSDVDMTGLRLASDRAAMRLVRSWDTGTGLEKMARSQVPSSMAVGLVSANSHDAHAILQTGRAMERLWLQASRMGLGIHPVSAPLFLSFEHTYGVGAAWCGPQLAALRSVSDEVLARFGQNGTVPLFLFRILRGDEVTNRSLRLPFEQIFSKHTSTTVNAWNA